MRDAINDAFVDVMGYQPSEELVDAIVDIMPYEIQGLAKTWGWEDTEVGDNMFRWMVEMSKLLKMIKS